VISVPLWYVSGLCCQQPVSRINSTPSTTNTTLTVTFPAFALLGWVNSFAGLFKCKTCLCCGEPLAPYSASIPRWLFAVIPLLPPCFSLQSISHELFCLVIRFTSPCKSWQWSIKSNLTWWHNGWNVCSESQWLVVQTWPWLGYGEDIENVMCCFLGWCSAFKRDRPWTSSHCTGLIGKMASSCVEVPWKGTHCTFSSRI